MKFALGMMAVVAVALPQQQRELTQPAPRLASIAMKTTSWGRLVAEWSIDAQGNLRYTSPEPDVFNAKRIVTRSFNAGTAGFRQIRVLIGEAEASGPRLACNQAMTDAVYGDVKWVQPNGRAKSLSFYTACSQPSTRRIVAQLGKADTLAKGWAMRGQIIETKPGEQAP